MTPEKLTEMANQIAVFFRSYPEDEAAAGIKRHITSFWTPRMRECLEESVERDQHGPDPLVVRALTRRATAGSPVVRVTSPSQEAGQMASDAG